MENKTIPKFSNSQIPHLSAYFPKFMQHKKKHLMNLSYWEKDTWLHNNDFTIIGSGIVGLNCALRLKERFPEARILILERSFLPNGASTKNAGFATFGSISEILADLNTHSEKEVLSLIKKRLNGLELLRKNLGDNIIEYQQWGGTELFTEEQEPLLQKCLSERERINELLLPLFGKHVFTVRENSFGFQGVADQCIFTEFEGQLHTGKMMAALMQKAVSLGIKILNNITVESFSEEGGKVLLKTDQFELKTPKLLITTNGFAFQLGIPSVKPARAQVLITEPIEDLQLRGTFHLEEGFYYFRNIDNRILLGGGRNLDFEAEETTHLEQTELIQNKLESLLQQVILPGKEVKIAHRWSGIMGVGGQKKPIVEQISENVCCGVRLGGMGVAIGSVVGQDLADLL